MESDESIHFVNSETVNAYAWAAVKEEHENPCKLFEEGENVDPRRFHSYIDFFLVKFAVLANQAAQKF